MAWLFDQIQWYLRQIGWGWRVIGQDFQSWLAAMKSDNPTYAQGLTDILGYHPTCCSYGTQPWWEYLSCVEFERALTQPLTEEEHEIVDHELAKIYGGEG